jgi:hypothetical protein
MLLIAPSILIMQAYLMDDVRALWSQVGYVEGSFVRLLAPFGVAWNLYGLGHTGSDCSDTIFLLVRSPFYRKSALLMMLSLSTMV